MYLSGFPSHSYLLLIHLSYVLNNNKKISYTRNRGHTGHSNWSWKWLLIKIWEEFMEITNCLWLNISSDRHTSMISRGQQLHFTGVFTALFLLFLCLFFPSKKKKKSECSTFRNETCISLSLLLQVATAVEPGLAARYLQQLLHPRELAFQ